MPLLFGLFRLAGSVKTGEMIRAFKQKRGLDGELKERERAFEEMQLQFRGTPDFAAWWQRVCEAAGRLGVLRMRLPLASRDGSERSLEWEAVNADLHDGCECLTAQVPVPGRRGDQPLRIELEVPATRSLETAGQTVTLFSRLMADHGVASLPASPTRRPVLNGDPAAADGPPAGLGCGYDGSVAIVHDFLYTRGGAERVLEQLIHLFPHAQLFSLFDFLPPEERGFLRGKAVTTSLIQHLPFARQKHRGYLPLMPFAIEQLDVTGYDLVVSSSYLAAKGVITGPDQTHICYCHSPARYAWDLQHQYLKQARMGFGPRALIARYILHYLRTWDARSAAGVDYFLANSAFVARRIEKNYRRPAQVVHPPVDTDAFFPGDAERDDFYVVASRLVPYKRVDLVVEAFSRIGDRRLVVIGDGPEMSRVRAAAEPNVEVMGHLPHARMVDFLQRARAFVFAAEEDFGIAPVEAMACGTPVIALGRGGVRDTVIDGETGVYFNEQTPESVVDAVRRFEARPEPWDHDAIRERAEQFSVERFRARITRFVADRTDDGVPPPERHRPMATDRPAAPATNGRQRDRMPRLEEPVVVPV